MDLLRSFDFTLPVPELDISLARTLTCVLLNTVLGSRSTAELSEPCRRVGMNWDVYRS
jgi:hypothetical protein